MSLFSAFELDRAERGASPGFRLDRLEWLNWGTFDGKAFHLDLGGSNALLTGDIGSGKSTVVDAISTLLLRADRISYNKAAGAEARERDLRSYVRGDWKSERNETTGQSRAVALRPKNTYSVLLAVFRNEALDQDVTLAQVFWIGAQREGQPERFYVTAVGRRLSIVHDFSGFGTKIATLKKDLKAAKLSVTDTFTEYEKTYRRALGIPSAQAMELFHQTVSMKSVGNLNDFVRSHMLEPFDAAASVRSLVGHFENLSAAHDAVVAARTQLERLAPMLTECDRYDRSGRRLLDLAAERAAIRTVADHTKHRLLSRERDDLRGQAGALEAELVVAGSELALLRDQQQGLRDARAGFAGGRLAQIDLLVGEKSKTRDDRQRQAGQFNTDLTKAGLPKVTAAEQLPARQAQAGDALAELITAEQSRQVKGDDLRARKRDLDRAAGDLQAEIHSLRERRSNIPLDYVNLRERLCVAVGLTPEDLPFVGELIQVRSQERRWQGAAERVLRGFGLSLAVREAHYPTVSGWINDNHLGARLVYLRVGHHRRRTPAADDSGETLASKLEVSDTDLRPWVAAELERRAGHLCVESMAQFRRSDKAVTLTGQVKSGDRHEKDDRRRIDDRSAYVLGWSNAEKVEALMARASTLHHSRQQLADQLRVLEAAGSSAQDRRDALTAVCRVELSQVDWWTPAAEITSLEEEKAGLEASSTEIQRIATQLAQVDAQITSADARQSALHTRLGAVGSQLTKATEALTNLAPALVTIVELDDAVVARARARLNEPTTTAECDRALTTAVDAISGDQQRATERRSEHERKAVQLMTRFRIDFPTLTTDLDDDIKAADEYRELARRLQSDDLPRFEADFKHALNKETINELAAFNGQLRRQQETIRERVAAINESLQAIDYNAHEGTYIALVAQDSPNTQVRDFRRDLRECTSDVVGEHDEQYSERKFLQVRKLITRFTGRDGYADLDRFWTRQVTDVRNWFVFSGSERYRENDEEREAFSDSDGKSGGQKEKLAYTILAASLAYQFKLDPGLGETKTFRFAVIDEAFGRGSDPSTRYALELFGAFGLQLLVVTPLQKVQVIEPYVSQVGYVSNPGGAASSLLNMTISQYRENRLAHAQREAAASGETLDGG